MKLSGIELRNFRSIGDEPVMLTPWRKCNILIGQNNTGKSNVIKAVQKISGRFPKGVLREDLTDLDLHRRSSENQFWFRLRFEGVDTEDEQLTHLAKTTSFYFDFTWEMGQDLAVTDYTLASIDDFYQAEELLSYLFGRRWATQLTADEIRKEFLEDANAVWKRFAGVFPPVYITRISPDTARR